jgi:hypothetical protein
MDKAMLWGLGFDGKESDKYITRGDNFYLIGGSQKTHEHMVDDVLRFNRYLQKYGKKMEDLSREEYYRILSEMGMNDRQWKYFH